MVLAENCHMQVFSCILTLVHTSCGSSADMIALSEDPQYACFLLDKMPLKLSSSLLESATGTASVPRLNLKQDFAC